MIREFIQSLREFVNTAALRRRISSYQIQRAKRRHEKKPHPSKENENK